MILFARPNLGIFFLEILYGEILELTSEITGRLGLSGLISSSYDLAGEITNEISMRSDGDTLFGLDSIINISENLVGVISNVLSKKGIITTEAGLTGIIFKFISKVSGFKTEVSIDSKMSNVISLKSKVQ